MWLSAVCLSVCLLMGRTFFGLTMADAMRLAYQLAVIKGIKNQFCKRTERAGRKWLKIFLRRHPQISFRTPEGRGFTPESVAQFFLGRYGGRFCLRALSGINIHLFFVCILCISICLCIL